MKTPIESLQEKNGVEEVKKIDKGTVGYIHKEGTDYTCAECAFYKEKKCALYGPQVSIEPFGGCNLWVQAGRRPAVPWIGGVTKVETAYLENKDGFSCKRCEEFLPEQKVCEKVNKLSAGDDPGIIAADACCNRWVKK